MTIVLKYGDHLEPFPTVAQANKWLKNQDDLPDKAWEEDDECEMTREFVVLNKKLVEG